MFGLTPAPELSRPGLQWFNVDRPLTMADLRGRLVVLEFWTGCCVNCLNVQQTLRRIPGAFADDAVLVVGVHSPKFPHEREPETLAHTLQRQDIRYPVVHDPDLLLWRDYGVRGWPTLVFVGPDGKVLGDLPGEPDADKLLSGIGQMVQGWRAGVHGPPPPLPLAHGTPRGTGANGSRLRYPTKIKPAGGGAQRQWICADSGHHQVVVLDDEGTEPPPLRLRRGRIHRPRPGRQCLQQPAGAGRQRPFAVRRRYRQPRHPPHRSGDRPGEHACRHRRARRRPLPAPVRPGHGAGLGLGSRAPRPVVVFRQRRHPSARRSRPRRRRRPPLRRNRAGGPGRRGRGFRLPGAAVVAGLRCRRRGALLPRQRGLRLASPGLGRRRQGDDAGRRRPVRVRPRQRRARGPRAFSTASASTGGTDG